jgi:allantoinase
VAGPAAGEEANQATGPFDLVIRAPRVISGGQEAGHTIAIAAGRIAAVEPLGSRASAPRVIEFGPDVVVLPGLVDSHVHICEPGNSEWEGFATATRAAAAGGITTLVDMPLDSVPSTVNVAALQAKRDAANGRCQVDVGFWGGVIPGNFSEIRPLCEAGVLGFKCFLADSGSDDFPPVTAEQMTDALGLLRELGSALLVHAEDAQATAAIGEIHSHRYADYLASRPRGLENMAIAKVIEAARTARGHAHIVHLSSSDALAMIASARREGVPVTAETCPHYLALTAEQITDGQTVFKSSPPIRETANRELLWNGMRDGVLDMVVSDHSPCTPAMKELGGGDFGTAWGGISSLQLALPVVWTYARDRGFALSDVARWMAERPARLAGLQAKGRIAPGFDADLCVFAPDESFVVDAAALHHRHAVTPYAGHRLTGTVRSTFLRGEPIDPGQRRGRLLGRRAPGDEGAGDSAAA